ncbi:MAG: glycosyltransferase [Opitutaceae bacterium]|jgi:glycosyltransferase involved in cell wall biosynthesis
MPAARILIISNGPLCRNPRVVKEASALGRAGHDVTVLTVRNHAPSEKHDVELLRDAPYRRETVDMLPGFGTPRRTVFCRRLVLWACRKIPRVLKNHVGGSLGPAAALLSHARRLTSDLVIVHNEAPHWVGTQLIKDGRRVCADLEDWHSEDLLPDDNARRPLGLIRDVERALLHHAVHTTTTSHALADAIHARYGGRRPHVIGNAFPLQPDPHTGAPGGPPAFFWFSQTLGPGRGLEPFFAAWKLTQHPSRVVLLGEVHGDYAQRLLARLPAERRAHVSFLPLVSPAELPSVIARHDIGLALEQSFIVNRDLTITNKIIQYLNAGLAVVASDTAGQREVLAHSPDAGIIIETHETARFAAALDALLADREALQHRQRAARQLAEQTYSWEREGPRLIALVARALSTPA